MATYKRQRYLFMTLDPVHIGTGGYRLGRVDNSIVREPGTKIPKIPGTSLHGAARSYAAQLYGTPGAAGQSHDKIDNPDQNPVCYTFGYVQKSKDEKSDDSSSTSTSKPIPKGSQDKNNDQGKAFSGVVNIFDAHILLFPVHSMVGPVWVTTVERLNDAEFKIDKSLETWNNNECINQVVIWNKSNSQSEKNLNLGWLMVNIVDTVTINSPEDSKWEEDKRYKAINRIVIVKDALFTQVVNSNLEVRTSVAIDPETGAANEGALFTYEAIPRATFLTAEVVLDDYGAGKEKNNDDKEKQNSNSRKRDYPFPKNKKFDSEEDIPGGTWNCPLCVVKAGFRMIEWLGVGGMGTRGFGRMAMIGDPINVELQTLFNQEKNYE
ncbi:type III-B CRISPR module RAMP protein Cmr4 [Cronbergia sp. UHCC 0137]|uniref:type III-B CRISPR module RAMP protein Cmr4 n=1 Tax=Cronbergia sp. UHCC 0137 TaxID=3110239 RepID=UPI002B206938|nr:type III-B CRISPR module RAMP protein Cmr4 [Cronbergia sp. UHCC 0137]MEA5617960.1 type III-B CRISPR module RAMP protein Cmr4 [Cronbergia sp. UHCC 0137]